MLLTGPTWRLLIPRSSVILEMQGQKRDWQYFEFYKAKEGPTMKENVDTTNQQIYLIIIDDRGTVVDGVTVCF